MARKPPAKPTKRLRTPLTRRARSMDDTRSKQQIAQDELKESDVVREWFSKIKGANKVYDEWEGRFEVKRGQDYYESRQWYGQTEEVARDKYVINLTFAAVETQKPSLLFDHPVIKMEPRPSREDQLAADFQRAKAKVCQDAVQTWIDDPNTKFFLETSLALQEAHFRFGIVEVGYSADFLDNPHAGKPALPVKEADLAAGKAADETGQAVEDEPDEDDADEDTDTPTQPKQVVKEGSERIYVKRIPASHFRASISNKNDLEANDFVAYWEWAFVSDLKNSKTYQNTDDLKPTGVLDGKYHDEGKTAADQARVGMVKLWRIWDLRRKVRHVLAEGHKKFLQRDKPWTHLPFADLKLYERLDSYYPIPVVYNWLGPQDEMNEQREGMRTHRRRFNRRYTYQKGSIEATEVQKLESGGDGVYAETNTAQALIPVIDAPMDAAALQTAQTAEQDFTIVSGVSGEQRQVPTADTATQASIMDSRARLRESAARLKVANWLGRIGRLMLLAMREHMQFDFAVKMQLDPTTATPEEKLKAALIWQMIGREDLGDIDMDVSVTLESLSPVVQDAERLAWNQLLALLSNPAILVIFTSSETLARKTMALYGITSEHEVQELLKVAAMMLAQLQQQAALAAAGGGQPGGVKLPDQAAAATAAGARTVGGTPVGMVQ